MANDEVRAGEVTELLIALRGGKEGAYEQLLPLLYGELRQIARRQIRRHRSSVTLDATGLVHDAYLKMVDQSRLDARDRGHFLAIAARAMRQILVDRARRRNAEKRGGEAAPIPLDEAPEPALEESEWLTDLDEALQRLGRHSERLARVVECRFFAGYNEEETAQALDTSLRTVQRDWQRARAWLKVELRGAAPAPGA